MVEMLRGEQAQPPLPPTDWPVARLSVDFALDIADIARAGGPVLDPLILAAVVEANVAPVNQDAGLQRAYGGLDAPPPDDLRRPVSVSAVAASLGLPFETVRRRLIRLAEAGECVIGPKGVLVPSARLASEAYARIAQARYERSRRLYYDLRALGALSGSLGDPGPPLPDTSPDLAAAAPVRTCNRLLSEYYLRLIEILMRRIGDPVSGLILLGLARANMAPLTPEQRASPRLFPEPARRPVRRATLAASLGLPSETVRRRLLELEARDYCRTSREGVSIAMESVLRPEAQRLIQENHANLHRFMARLRRYGVLDRWDAEAAA